jgi:hypothetical protein
MPAGRKPALLAQGKPRTSGGSSRPWRVRLHAPLTGSNKYQVFFKAPGGSGGQLSLRQTADSLCDFDQVRPIHLSTISDRTYWTLCAGRPSHLPVAHDPRGVNA